MIKSLVFPSLRKLYACSHRSQTLSPWCLTKKSKYTTNTISQVDNIILMGSPGSGKTSIGKILASHLQYPVIDIDNDYLERFWGVPVAKKLEEVGGNNFVKAEGEALLQFTLPSSPCVISLTGSNPMHSSAMEYAKKLGTVVFLDVQSSDILERLERMKINRIVGQTEGVSMAEILKYRQQFYKGSYDIRVVCEENESAEGIARKIQEAVEKFKSEKNYISSRQAEVENSKTFNDVVLEGLAPDGGLYIPKASNPKFSKGQWERLINMSYQERAQRILEQWIHPTHLHPNVLSSMLKRAYSAEHFEHPKVFPIVHIQDNIYANELFHGPTASFKDAALQLLPEFFNHAVETSGNDNDRYLFLVATSGDTGSAVLSGFNDMASKAGVCRVMVLYPEEGVSQVQKKQMKSAEGDGLHVVGVKSDFDFCQSAIKKIFNDSNIINNLTNNYGFKLSAANSINWGRLLPQIVYHASGYLDLVERNVISMGDPVDLCVPTGNFGNILAAYYAKEMGIPYRRLICASNVNNVLTDFFNTGTYDLTHRKLHVTAAPAIDILRSSNLERYLYHMSGNDSALVASLYHDLSSTGKFIVPNQLLQKIQQAITGDWCTEEQCFEAIRDTFQKTGYLLDPHTAVAKVVADRHNPKDCPLVIAATAHYAKFAPDVLASLNQSQKTQFDGMSPEDMFGELEALNSSPVMHRTLKDCIVKPTVHEKVCDANVNDIINEMYSFVEKTC